MLQDLRKSTQGTAAKVVVGLIVVSFASFGIQSILVGSGGSAVAEVNGEEIGPQALQQAVNNQKRRLISMMGDNLDPSMLDDEILGKQALEGLISRRLLMQSATEMKLTVSEQEIGRMVGGMEEFQINGVFSPELYKSTLANAGFTPASFKQTLREDVLVSQLRSGLAGSEFATEAELQVNARVVAEQRDLRYFTMPLQSFITDVEFSDEEIQQFHTVNEALFMQAESVLLDYVELSVEDFREPVAESTLQEAYELEVESYDYGVRNKVSHILFEEDGETPLADRVAAAQAALAQGREFADVATEFSEDIGSASNGGDLGYSGGDAFPTEMEEAIAALALNTVSEPVATDAGTHLLLVTDRQDSEAPSLDDMRMELQESLQLAEARVQLLRRVEDLKDQVFIAEDLSGPAEDLGLTVKQSEPITRGQNGGLFANPVLVSAAFSEDVLDQGHNSEVLEIAGDNWVALRVRTHNPAAVTPLVEVRDEVVAALTEERANENLALAAEAALGALRGGVSVEEYANAQGYEWNVELAAQRNNPIVPRDLLQRAFALPAPGEGSSVAEYIASPTGDVHVFELVRVAPGDYETLEANTKTQLQRQVSGEYSSVVDSEFQRGLRDSADITVL